MKLKLFHYQSTSS